MLRGPILLDAIGRRSSGSSGATPIWLARQNDLGYLDDAGVGDVLRERARPGEAGGLERHRGSLVLARRADQCRSGATGETAKLARWMRVP
jgi:hypothetical protein